jgi:enamine deaminase RidA (YjgF/YER057c/UK114 family)
MPKKLISSGSSFEEKIGYSRAVVQDKWIFVSGTTGYNYENMTISPNVTEQAEQCLLNIQSALEQADASLSDVVRVTYILKETKEFEKCWPILEKYFGQIKPAATMFSAGLADDKMKIEIQVTALKS